MSLFAPSLGQLLSSLVETVVERALTTITDSLTTLAAPMPKLEKSHEGVSSLKTGHSDPAQPALGRFLVRDPIRYEGGTNLYAYCGNNPVNCVDPFGLQTLGEANWDPTLNGVTGVTHMNRPQDVGNLFLGVIKGQGESISTVGAFTGGPLGTAGYVVDAINAAASGDPLQLLGSVYKGVPRRRFDSRADEFDWDHIYTNHAEWGKVSKQRGPDNSVFVQKTERQIQAIVKEAWNRRKPTGRKQYFESEGLHRVAYRGIDPISGWEIEMWYIRELKLVKTAYPIGVTR